MASRRANKTIGSGITLRRKLKLFYNCRHQLHAKFHTSFKAEAAVGASKDSKKLTTLQEARRFMVDCFKIVGASQENAEVVADNLLEADYRGHYSHGMNRLGLYIKSIQTGSWNPNAQSTIERETVATAVVDGHNGLGAVIGKFCMDQAIKKAKTAGIGLVVAHDSNHYGIAAWYVLQAINEGYIGMAVSNTAPFMVPTRGKTAALGTNPIALGAPGAECDSFVLDMATTAVAVGKIEIARRKGEKIPEGWALNKDGKEETNAENAFKEGKLMPLGGSELNSGYKGYGLAMFVEIFSGLLAGSCFGPNIQKWRSTAGVANLGQGFLAVNPKFFTPCFEDRLSQLMDQIRQMPPADPKKPILIPGDPERIHMEKVKKDGGVFYVRNQHETNAKLAQELGVKPMVSTLV